uniref:Uncharacterized protein AlNc14C374G11143 n=1 Tax=Albugo laibachii Nc14 TaxID=890382 RepID=F0WY83_9STRA|nr:conserved hypothetical protein [Albugo laibachii Nc14]|eukprot:CCA26435.1 conserved hypothetical protein [Albugo laibachii Nc14]
MRGLQTQVPFAVRNEYEKSESTWQSSGYNTTTSSSKSDLVANGLSLQNEPLEDPEFEDLFSMLHYLDFESPIQHFENTVHIRMSESSSAPTETLSAPNDKAKKIAETVIENKGRRQRVSSPNPSVEPKAPLNDSLCTNVISGSDESDTPNPPVISPATLNWLHSLASSSNCGSWNGHVSPLTISSVGSNATPSQNSSVGSPSSFNEIMAKPTPLTDLELGRRRSTACESIDWKSYNESKVNTEHNKGKKTWRIIPQHRPPGDTGTNMKSKFFKSDVKMVGKQQQHSALDEETLIGKPTACEDTKYEGKKNMHSLKADLSRGENQSAFTHSRANNSFVKDDNGRRPLRGMSEFELYQYGTSKKTPTLTLDEKNKRKAIVSPEYDQYESHDLNEHLIQSRLIPQDTDNLSGKSRVVPSDSSDGLDTLGSSTYPKNSASNSARSTRRPSKKILQPKNQIVHLTPIEPSTIRVNAELVYDVPECNDKEVANQTRCKCTGRCRNARCACVKAGAVCSHECKCFGCLNPFKPMAEEGILISRPAADTCLMHSLSKIKDMKKLLNSYVTYSCCESYCTRDNDESSDQVVKVKDTIVDGFTCPSCSAHFTFSWCGNRLCHDEKKPRNHCVKCRRCVDHRNQHCDDCNRCYFAGVANSFPCNCKKEIALVKSKNYIKGRSLRSAATMDSELEEIESTRNHSVAERITSTKRDDLHSSIGDEKANQMARVDQNEEACPVQ